MCYMPLHTTTSLQFPQLFEDFAVKMFKAIKCKNVSATHARRKIWDSWDLSQLIFVSPHYLVSLQFRTTAICPGFFDSDVSTESKYGYFVISET